jgi:hypothetical protein
MQRVRLVGIIFCAALLLSVAPAFATVVNTYTDQATWLAASSGVQNVDFEGLAPTNGQSGVYWGLTLDNVAFSGVQGAGGFGMVVVDTNYSQYFNFGTNDALELAHLITSPTPSFHIVLPAAVTSFSLDLMSVSPTSMNFIVTADGSAFNVPTYGTPTPGFFGATFDTPVSSIDVTALGVIPGNDSYVLLDNFSFGAANVSQPDPVGDVPEAGTLMMIGSGLVGITSIMKRRASRKARQ